MKKAHAMKWINALRSGDFKQGFAGKLKDDNGGYCCLGVLCEIFPEMNLAGDSLSELENGTEIGLSSIGELPSINGHDYPSLAELNDGTISQYSLDGRYSFDEIADIIQIEYVEGL